MMITASLPFVKKELPGKAEHRVLLLNSASQAWAIHRCDLFFLSALLSRLVLVLSQLVD